MLNKSKLKKIINKTRHNNLHKSVISSDVQLVIIPKIKQLNNNGIAITPLISKKKKKRIEVSTHLRFCALLQ